MGQQEMRPIVYAIVTLLAWANMFAFVGLLPTAILCGLFSLMGAQPQMALTLGGVIVMGFHLWRTQ
jgi:hypothetical protein